MRPELERIAQIERYLNDEMDGGERSLFDAELQRNPALRADLQLQRDVAGGVSRGVLKTRIRHAGRRFHQLRRLKQSIIGGAAAVAVTLLCFWLIKPGGNRRSGSSEQTYAAMTLPALNEQGKPEWATADSNIAAQIFNIDGARDTVISTQSGMVMAIPAGSFVDAAGKRADGPISLCMKEAFDAATIMSAGLSTMSDGRLLETGGMFFIDARNATGTLKIDPQNPLYAEIPAGTRDPEMMMFSGQRKPDGSINWIDPKPLPKDLMTVDMASLDFYPREFLPTLSGKNYSIADRRFTDSVYYSMAEWFGMDPQSAGRYGLSSSQIDSIQDQGVVRSGNVFMACGINPGKIAALRSGKFDNTFIATKEFAERLKLIHDLKSQRLLDLYANNIDLNLYEVDSMAAGMDAANRFDTFVAQRLGKVRNGSKHFDMLRNFYSQHSKLITETIVRTQQQIRERDASQDRVFQRRSAEQGRTDARRASNMYAEEFWQNLNSTYRQLGFQRAPDLAFDAGAARVGIPAAFRQTLQVSIANTGWFNIDKYVQQVVPLATRTRSSTSFQDPGSGRVSQIRYEALNLRIADAATYDRILVYILTDKLSSFMRVGGSGGAFAEKLNMQFRNDLVCIGFKGTERFIFTRKNVQPGAMTGLRLQAVDSLSFLKQLQGAKDFGIAMNLADDAAFEQYRLGYNAGTKRRKDWQDLLGILQQRLYPCMEVRGSDRGGSEGELNSDASPVPDGTWLNRLPELDNTVEYERSTIRDREGGKSAPRAPRQ